MLKITIIETINGEEVTTEKEFTPTDHMAILNDLPSFTSWLFPKVENSIKGNNGDRGGAVFHKIYQCRKRLCDKSRPEYFADPTVNTDDELILAVTSKPGYMNRIARDLAELSAPPVK